jgi:pyruvate/2-oxoglutarate dehydrogenase complex dihydrolipoamide dehydrogenase (E3) component
MVRGLVTTHLTNFKKNNTELALGEGRFIGERTLQVEMHEGPRRTLEGGIVVLSTGTRAKIDDIPGLAEAAPLTHIEALELDTVPQHLIVLGGGYIGLEFAQALKRLGSKVTIVERAHRLLPREDQDVSEAVRSLLADEDIDVITGAAATSVTGRSGDAVSIELETANRRINGTHILAATGRIPNTEGIGLELAGVQKTDRGYIQVNEKLETTAPGVWAVGDCAGSPLFTHIAFDDYRVFRDNYAGKKKITTGRQVPFCLFTDPELARVGLNETEATVKGIPYRLGKLPMAAVLRARTLSETRGFLKALVGADDTILGFTGFGSGAGELLPAIQLAMASRLPYTSLRDMVITHPTMAEGLAFLFATVPAQAA